jgi:hypothetical protein
MGGKRAGEFRYVWLYKNPHHAAALQTLAPTADALYEPSVKL